MSTTVGAGTSVALAATRHSVGPAARRVFGPPPAPGAAFGTEGRIASNARDSFRAGRGGATHGPSAARAAAINGLHQVRSLSSMVDRNGAMHPSTRENRGIFSPYSIYRVQYLYTLVKPSGTNRAQYKRPLLVHPRPAQAPPLHRWTRAGTYVFAGRESARPNGS